MWVNESSAIRHLNSYNSRWSHMKLKYARLKRKKAQILTILTFKNSKTATCLYIDKNIDSKENTSSEDHTRQNVKEI